VNKLDGATGMAAENKLLWNGHLYCAKLLCSHCWPSFVFYLQVNSTVSLTTVTDSLVMLKGRGQQWVLCQER